MERNVPIVPVMKGEHTAIEWLSFFRSIVRLSKDSPESITLTGSPFAYTAIRDGTIVINGGTVSGVSLTRNGWVLALGANANPITIYRGDVVTITYTVAPVVSFVPT